MRLGSAIGGLGMLATREFWSFRVIHALLGGLLTVGGATGALVIGDTLRRDAVTIDSRVAAMSARIDSIRTTLAQFRVVQSNGVLLGALASSGTLADDYREQFVQLMFVLRRGPDVALLGEIHLADVDAFARERDELDRLIAVAVSPERTSRSWNDVLTFEMAREQQLMDLQTDFETRRMELQADRRRIDASIDSATFTGFLVQQIGFVVILLAGLIYQHSTGQPAAPGR